jgi:hypothetical protein
MPAKPNLLRIHPGKISSSEASPRDVENIHTNTYFKTQAAQVGVFSKLKINHMNNSS